MFRVPLQQSPRRRPLPGRVGPGGPAAPAAPGIARPNNVPQQAKPTQAYVPPPGQLLKRYSENRDIHIITDRDRGQGH